MKISNSRDFRNSVLEVERLLKLNSYLGVVNFSHGLDCCNKTSGRSLDSVISQVLDHREGYLTFEVRQSVHLQKNPELRRRLRKFSGLRIQLRSANNKEIRKQNDDAPKGADSIGVTHGNC